MTTVEQEDLGDVYPWQRSQWAMLARRIREGTLPHALLLAGAQGMGKHRFARSLAKALLCADPDAEGQACGRCRSCILYDADSHPDINRVMPEEEGKPIKIDQVRALREFIGLTSQYGRYKIALISPAEQMNVHAGASLLKTLEEPTPGAIFILVSPRPGALAATIRSRCQQVTFPVPPTQLAEQWLASQSGVATDAKLLLQLAGGAPLAALALANSEHMDRRSHMLGDLDGLLGGRLDPVPVAESWLKWGGVWTISVLTGFVMDLIRLKAVGEHPRLAHCDAREDLQLLAERLDLNEIFGFLDELTEARRLSAIQVNQQMLMERLLIHWTEFGERHRAAARSRNSG